MFLVVLSPALFLSITSSLLLSLSSLFRFHRPLDVHSLYVVVLSLSPSLSLSLSLSLSFSLSLSLSLSLINSLFFSRRPLAAPTRWLLSLSLSCCSLSLSCSLAVRSCSLFCSRCPLDVHSLSCRPLLLSLSLSFPLFIINCSLSSLSLSLSLFSFSIVASTSRSCNRSSSCLFLNERN